MFIVDRNARTQCTAFKDMQTFLLVYSVQGKKFEANYYPKSGIRSVQDYQKTVYSVQNLRKLLLVYSVQEKKDVS